MSSPAFVNEVLDGDTGRQTVTLAQPANVSDRFGGCLPRHFARQRFPASPRLDAFNDHFVDRAEVAIL